MPFRHEVWNNLPLEWLTELWDAIYETKRIVGHNLKFDLAIMHQDGFYPQETHEMADTLVAGRMCSAERYPDLSLSHQLEEWLGPGSSAYDKEFKTYLRKNKWNKAYYKAPPAVLGEYCTKDVMGTWALKELYEEYIQETDQTEVWNQEQVLTATLWQMERDGLGYDEGYGEAKIPQLQARIANLTQEVYDLVGDEFNLNSGPQLTKAMNSLGITSPQKSVKTGKDQWTSGVMLTIEHPVAGKILEVRSLEKVLGTYFMGITSWPNGRVHGQFKNWGTVTGRLSATDPNLQNIAKNVQNLLGNEINEDTLAALSAFLGVSQGGDYMNMVGGTGGISGGLTLGGTMAVGSSFSDQDYEVSVRRLFIPQEGYRLYFLDYSQMEMRVFSDYVQDEGMIELLESATFDFHSMWPRRFGTWRRIIICGTFIGHWPRR